MLCQLGNSFTKVHDATDAEIAWLFDFLSFEDVNADRKQRMVQEKIRYACKAKGYTEEETQERIESAQVGDRIRLFKRSQRVYPTGLHPLVRKGAARMGHTITEVDARPDAPVPSLVGLDGEPLTLRPYQVETVRAALSGPQAIGQKGVEDARFAEYLLEHADPGRGMIWVPTGGGKSRMAVAMAHAVPGKWLFLVHRGHLAEDVKGRWDSTVGPIEGCEAGMIGAGEWRVGERLTCATLQTLHDSLGSQRFKDLAKEVTGVIVDEAHVAPAATFYKTIMSLDAARYRIGLSGTPLARGDRKGLVAIGAMGPVIYRVRPQELIDQGYLAPPTIRVIPCYQKTPAGLETYRECYDALIVDSAHRNAAVTRAAVLCEKPGIVFVESLRHGSLLTRFLRKQGLNVEFISGKTKKDLRIKGIKDLADGRLDLLVATRVFNEGVDIPDLRSVVMAAAGKSEIAAIQRVGRALRPAEGKESATIYEFGDKGNRFLHDHAVARFRSYRGEGYPVIVDQDVWPEKRNNDAPLHQAWLNLITK